MRAQGNAPVIIKRKKVVGGGGHHGGAWKVAYADFVTAMMAFFLLMWLLGATTENQRRGIADYFGPSIPINSESAGGDGNFGGDDMASEKALSRDGTGAKQFSPAVARAVRGKTGLSPDTGSAGPARTAEEIADFRNLEDRLLGRSGESEVAEALRRHILTRVTDEGLVIELFDLPDAQLFESESDSPTALLDALAELLASAAALVENPVAVGAYVRAVPVVRRVQPAWPLSVERAQRMRMLLENAGLESRRVRRVTGHGDRAPVAPDPVAVRNNRVQIILLRSDRKTVSR